MGGGQILLRLIDGRGPSIRDIRVSNENQDICSHVVTNALEEQQPLK